MEYSNEHSIVVLLKLDKKITDFFSVIFSIRNNVANQQVFLKYAK